MTLAQFGGQVLHIFSSEMLTFLSEFLRSSNFLVALEELGVNCPIVPLCQISSQFFLAQKFSGFHLFCASHCSAIWADRLLVLCSPHGSSHFLVMKADELRLSKEFSEFEFGHMTRPILHNLTHQLEQGRYLKCCKFWKNSQDWWAKLNLLNYFDHSMLGVFSFR